MLVQVFDFHKEEDTYNLDVSIISKRRAWTSDEVMETITKWAKSVEKRLYEVYGGYLDQRSPRYRELLFFLSELAREKIHIATIPENTYGFDGKNLDKFKGEKLLKVYVDWGSPFHHFYTCPANVTVNEVSGRGECTIIGVKRSCGHLIVVQVDLYNAGDLFLRATKNFTRDDYEKALAEELFTKVADSVKSPYRKYLVAVDYRRR